MHLWVEGLALSRTQREVFRGRRRMNGITDLPFSEYRNGYLEQKRLSVNGRMQRYVTRDTEIALERKI